MRESFYIGLSWLSSVEKGQKGRLAQEHSAEGRRIVSLLDAELGQGGAVSDGLFAREPEGRPYFTDHHADFSISHSRNMAAASFILPSEGTPCRTGCDIQYLDPRKSCVGIGRRFFHAGEQAYIEESPETQIRNFYRVWVLKEAWLKLHGFSVFEMAKTPTFSIGGVPEAGADNNKNGLVFFLYEFLSPCGDAYALAIARQKNHFPAAESEPEIRWFSDTVLTLNRVENIYAAHSPENTVMPKI